MANPIANYVNYDRHNKAVEAFNGEKYPELNHLSPERLRELSGIRNASAHAYVSAMIERENFPGLAKSLGTAREWQSWLSDKWSGNDDTKDHLRDEWNNDVGRQIGRYAKEHDLGEADVMELVDYARPASAKLFGVVRTSILVRTTPARLASSGGTARKAGVAADAGKLRQLAVETSFAGRRFLERAISRSRHAQADDVAMA